MTLVELARQLRPLMEKASASLDDADALQGVQLFPHWRAGIAVADEDQVWTLIQPHRAADYEGRPSTLRALWGLAHTKDPARAKPWVDAYGTSGMYMVGECYRAEDGTVYRCKQDNCVWDATGLPSAWEEVQQ